MGRKEGGRKRGGNRERKREKGKKDEIQSFERLVSSARTKHDFRKDSIFFAELQFLWFLLPSLSTSLLHAGVILGSGW